MLLSSLVHLDNLLRALYYKYAIVVKSGQILRYLIGQCGAFDFRKNDTNFITVKARNMKSGEPISHPVCSKSPNLNSTG